MFSIPEELKKLPQKPGVYIMKDENGVVIYVGKAINLRNRVRSYFRESNPDFKARSMARKVALFEYIVTGNEMEAFILECNLIKQHNPKYNIRLKDDKAYPYIKLTGDLLPRIVYAHERDRRDRGKAKFFGPYTSGDRVREIIKLVHDIWPLRRCQRRFPRDYEKDRPCLNYHMGRCKAPCQRFITEEEYNRMISEAVQFIQGKTEPVAAKLTLEMTECAERMEFEKAAELRNLLHSLKMLSEKQNADNCAEDDRDVIAAARSGSEALIQIFFVRGGKINGREHFMMQGIGTENSEGQAGDEIPTDGNDADDDTDDAEALDTESEIYTAFVKQFYSEAAFIPKEIVLGAKIDEAEAVSEWLTYLKGQKVYITVPQKGDKHKLVQLAANNAALTLAQFGSHIKKEAERNKSALRELTEILKLGAPPARVEAYDISNIQGIESVGSMIVFEDGKPKNSDYRKFKIKETKGPDDYASMEEVISRRFARYFSETASEKEKDNESGAKRALEGKFSKLPDLIMIDGGKGQVHAAEKILRGMSLSIPVCGMVKDDRHRTRGLMYHDEELLPPRHGECFKLITRIQDEVHRFAVEYHRKLRADSQVRSVLDDIPGIGPLRRKALMRHFKGIENIRKASVDELAQVDSMNRKSAEAVFKFFHSVM